MSSLSEIIKTHIRQYGPINVQDYWMLCQSHPVHGYYMKQDPLGGPGDFITAPEISQMFGELIGIWVADMWLKMKKPNPFYLVECGAGRGTMMDDLLRATKALPGFAEAVQVHIVETSPFLRNLQEQKLLGNPVIWHDTLESVPTDHPIIILGNEFLDALPVRQVIRMHGKWHEKMIGLDGDNLAFGFGGELPFAIGVDAPDGAVFEFAPQRDAVWSAMTDRLRHQTGAALMIDYGHGVTGFGDTFQAMKSHEYVDPLDNPGDADLTSHVDFGRLSDLAKDLAPKFATQGDFLKGLGIELRTGTLSKNATPGQLKDLQSGMTRLIAPDQMGTLFKVLAVSYPTSYTPAGFSD